MTDPANTGLSVILIPKAAEALAHAAGITGDTKTDTVNRALQLYDWAVTLMAAGGEVHGQTPDGSISRVEIR